MDHVLGGSWQSQGQCPYIGDGDHASTVTPSPDNAPCRDHPHAGSAGCITAILARSVE
jgi:hypothetical protein